MQRLSSLFIAIIFCFSSFFTYPLYSAANIPSPSTLTLPQGDGNSPLLLGVRFNPDNPLNLEFVFDLAGNTHLDPKEAKTAIEFFMAGLTMSGKDIWVNLSPYEPERIMCEPLVRTETGKTLLEQDYTLKQLAASLTYPEQEPGQSYWNTIEGKYDFPQTRQTRVTPANTFNKVWILPGKAQVYQIDNAAFITQADLRAMTEDDYLAFTENKKSTTAEDVSLSAFRANILPVIEKEANSGKHFMRLRQIYRSMVLAAWFKKKFKESFYGNYIDKQKIEGINHVDPGIKAKIYMQYVNSFRQGVYDYVKREVVPVSRKINRRAYFSGGINPFPETVALNGRSQDVHAGQVVLATATNREIDVGFYPQIKSQYAQNIRTTLSQALTPLKTHDWNDVFKNGRPPLALGNIEADTQDLFRQSVYAFVDAIADDIRAGNKITPAQAALLLAYKVHIMKVTSATQYGFILDYTICASDPQGLARLALDKDPEKFALRQQLFDELMPAGDKKAQLIWELIALLHDIGKVCMYLGDTRAEHDTHSKNLFDRYGIKQILAENFSELSRQEIEDIYWISACHNFFGRSAPGSRPLISLGQLFAKEDGLRAYLSRNDGTINIEKLHKFLKYQTLFWACDAASFPGAGFAAPAPFEYLNRLHQGLTEFAVQEKTWDNFNKNFSHFLDRFEPYRFARLVGSSGTGYDENEVAGQILSAGAHLEKIGAFAQNSWASFMKLFTRVDFTGYLDQFIICNIKRSNDPVFREKCCRNIARGAMFTQEAANTLVGPAVEIAHALNYQGMPILHEKTQIVDCSQYFHSILEKASKLERQGDRMIFVDSQMQAIEGAYFTASQDGKTLILFIDFPNGGKPGSTPSGSAVVPKQKVDGGLDMGVDAYLTVTGSNKQSQNPSDTVSPDFKGLKVNLGEIRRTTLVECLK